MDSVKSFFRQAWLVLLLAVVLGGSLAIVERSLEAKIAENAAARLEHAILNVVPGGATSEEVTANDVTVYRVSDAAGAVTGWAIPAESMGFSDKIKLLVGVSADAATITGLAVLESKETPGLGERMRESEFREEFNGKPTDAKLTVVKPGESADQPIDAITGATISSRAAVKAVNDCLKPARDAILAMPSR